MKKIKKNQMIITALAIMIAVAGYINYSGSLRNKLDAAKTGSSQIKEVENNDAEPDDISLVEPGTAVLTSTGNVSSVISAAKLNREQVRAKNKEALFEVIQNENISEAAKKDAIAQITSLTAAAEREMAAELLLEAKGFENAVVSVVGDSADVVIGRTSLTDVERAQIEDIVKRKTNVAAQKITINVCNNQKD